MKADLDGLWWLVAALVGSVVLTLGVLSLGTGVIVPALWMLLPVVVWSLSRKLLNTPYLSPVTIVAGIFWAIATFGYILRDVLGLAGTRGASVEIALTDEAALQTLQLMSVASTLIIAASALTIQIFAKPVAASLETHSAWRKPKSAGLILLASAVPLVAIVANVGVADLIERNYYVLGERGSLLGSVGGLLATAAVLVVGYAFGASKAGGKLVCLLLLVGYATLLLSYGSRRLAMIPILFALGVFIASNTRKSRFGIAVAGMLSFALLPLPLEFRSNSTHGIAPYMESFSTFTLADVDWLGALNNILVAFPIIGESAYGPKPVLLSDILISLNPMPGTDAGWYEVYPRLRLNYFTPMAGIGELGHVGWVAVIPFFLALGIFLAWMEMLVRKQMQGGSPIFVGVIIAIAALFALQMLQYNLRSATRFLVYFAVAEIARQACLVVARTRQRTPHRSAMELLLARQLEAQAQKAEARNA